MVGSVSLAKLMWFVLKEREREGGRMVPYSLFAHGPDEVLDSRLSKMLVVIFNEF